MSWSLRLFRVRGIEIRVHVTFLLILVWAAYSWGDQAKGWLQGALLGVVVTLLLFLCVTLHELAHSLTAQRYGVKVISIMLLPIGGVSQMEEMPSKPAQELLVALAGPATNVVIAALLLLIGRLVGVSIGASLGQLSIGLWAAKWSSLLPYMVWANAFLALFNLLPAFPMDGGRVLRALLALRLDYARATTVAMAVGQVLAVLLGLWGFISGNLSLILVAIFVYMGAGAEGREVEVKNVLQQMRVRGAMSHDVKTLSPLDPLIHAVESILQGHQSNFPVLEEGRLVGLLLENDILVALHQGGTGGAVGQVMRREFPVVHPEESLFEAQKHMAERRIGAVPVVEGEVLVGLLTIQDVSEAYRLLKVLPEGWRAQLSR